MQTIRSPVAVVRSALLVKRSLADKKYGYKSKIRVERDNDRIPKSFFEFAVDHVRTEVFEKKYRGMMSDPYRYAEDRAEAYEIRRRRLRLKELKLNDENIWERECRRTPVNCPRVMKSLYYFICWTLDVIYKDKPIDRFWFLEIIARMPYFSYIAVIHMYETLGWWETGHKLKAKHYQEEANETHHLRIMESLGGDSLWWNRFLARHVAMGYYGALFLFFLFSPKYAYMSSELLELHAVDTYKEFLESNEEVLRTLPPTLESYEYMPYASSMYDIFDRIAYDEYKHALSMKYMTNLPK
jgi:ubiquinol oxidase